MGAEFNYYALGGDGGAGGFLVLTGSPVSHFHRGARRRAPVRFRWRPARYRAISTLSDWKMIWSNLDLVAVPVKDPHTMPPSGKGKAPGHPEATTSCSAAKTSAKPSQKLPID